MLNCFDGITFRRFQEDGGHRVGPHAHDLGQFSLIHSGAVVMAADSRLWIVPRQRVVWIPPRVVHSARSQGPVVGWMVLVPQNFAEGLPQQICILDTSPLMVAALERLTLLDESKRDMATSLTDVVRLELAQAKSIDLQIPLPRSQRLRAVAEQIIERPRDGQWLDDGASAAALSRRSFSRHFAQETGMSFVHWQKRVKAVRAVEMLAAGESVASVALALGYESVSAFIAMFKRLHGAPPAKFMAGKFHSAL